MNIEITSPAVFLKCAAKPDGSGGQKTDNAGRLLWVASVFVDDEIVKISIPHEVNLSPGTTVDITGLELGFYKGSAYWKAQRVAPAEEEFFSLGGEK